MMRIYLIGFMGCGKTTWGRKLSTQMNLAFIDLDKYIEERMFMTVPEIFEKMGQDEFRKIERKYLQEVSELDNVIISTGGGAPCFFDNIQYMNAHGLTIYMNLSEALLVTRLTNSKNKRPLVDGKTGDELLAYITEMLAYRNQFYKQAHFIMNPIEYSIETLAEEIQKRMDAADS